MTPNIPDERTFPASYSQFIEIQERERSAPHLDMSSPFSGLVHEVIVEDNGIGIEPEYHERVFGFFSGFTNRMNSADPESACHLQENWSIGIKAKFSLRAFRVVDKGSYTSADSKLTAFGNPV